MVSLPIQCCLALFVYQPLPPIVQAKLHVEHSDRIWMAELHNRHSESDNDDPSAASGEPVAMSSGDAGTEPGAGNHQRDVYREQDLPDALLPLPAIFDGVDERSPIDWVLGHDQRIFGFRLPVPTPSARIAL